MTFETARTVVVVGQSIQHRYANGRVKDGSFTITSREDGELKVRNNKGNPRTVKFQDWDETLASLKALGEGSEVVSRQTMKTRN